MILNEFGDEITILDDPKRAFEELNKHMLKGKMTMNCIPFYEHLLLIPTGNKCGKGLWKKKELAKFGEDKETI